MAIFKVFLPLRNLLPRRREGQSLPSWGEERRRKFCRSATGGRLQAWKGS
jgi:hypothetical protein